jgi:transcriptional regulator with XRE-family HTH domain
MRLYNNGQNTKQQEALVMPRKLDLNDTESFGDRMARFRSKAGYSQRELANETGISQRMIAYYEKQSKHPPTHLLPTLAKALGTSADELLGIKQSDAKMNKKDMRLWRRFSQIENMPTKDKRQIMQLLDTFIEKEKLKAQTEEIQ